ncbi:MAG: OmpH family outer membrane protein [Opitutales bacterium]|jgi:Skp family chaperone for outer membrane proteins
MRNVTKLLLPILAMGAFAFNTATAELSVVTVSMQQLFDGYYKSNEANQRLETLRENAVAEAKEKEKQLQEMVASINAAQEELQNPMLSEEAKAEKQAGLEQSVGEARQSQAEFQQWQQRTMGELNQRGQEIRRSLIEEIAKLVNEIALRDYQADLVLDTSDIMGSGVPTVLYAADSLDITEKVMAKLNADAPALAQ